MKHTKQTFITAFALFSLFFGAGNLILPPFLGYNSGQDWFWVLLGFLVSAVVIPILAIYGHAKLQGSLLDFGKKVSPKFALLFAIIIYFIYSNVAIISVNEVQKGSNLFSLIGVWWVHILALLACYSIYISKKFQINNYKNLKFYIKNTKGRK